MGHDFVGPSVGSRLVYILIGHQQIVENRATNYSGVVPQLRVIMHDNTLYRNTVAYHFWNFGSR